MLMINLLGAVLIVAIIYWFWLYKPTQTETDDNTVTIVVDNGVYQPSIIKLLANSKVMLTFNRKDSTPCAETVIFPQLDISKSLAMGDDNKITLPALAAGEYDFHCQMQMYKGKLVVQ